jgi:hypothetical protein
MMFAPLARSGFAQKSLLHGTEDGRHDQYLIAVFNNLSLITVTPLMDVQR